MKTNILVQYRGGGYDGCIWEWNFFYIDKQGKFYDIFSSGCDGIDNLQDAEKLIDSELSGLYIYDVSKDEDITEFAKESNIVLVSNVLQFFNDNIDELDIQFFAICEECGCQIGYYEDIILEQDMILCQDCYSTGECLCCESYVGDTEIVKVNQDEHGFDYICTDCKDYHDGEREANNLKDLQFRAFCTGKPDIFSEEMRSFWV